MNALGIQPTEEELKRIQSSFALRPDGFFHQHQFKQMVAKKMSQRRGSLVLQAFKLFDKDNSGFISLQNLQDVVKELGNEELQLGDLEEMINLASSTGSGVVTYSDFERIMTNQPPPVEKPDPKDISSKVANG